MVTVIPTYGTNGKVKPEPLNVPDRLAQRYLDRGWQLAEGETFEPTATRPKGGRVLEVNQDLVPRTYKPGENDGLDTDTSTGVDTGLPLGANDVVREPLVQQDGRKITMNVPDGPRPGVSGKTKAVLLGIAATEGIEVDPELSKPEIKKAIEDARGEPHSLPDATDNNLDEDVEGGVTNDDLIDDGPDEDA